MNTRFKQNPRVQAKYHVRQQHDAYHQNNSRSGTINRSPAVMNDWWGEGLRLVLSTAASNTFTASPKTFHISLLTHTYTNRVSGTKTIPFHSYRPPPRPLRNLHLLSLTAMLSAAFFPAVIRWQSINIPTHLPYHPVLLPKRQGKSRHLYTGSFQLVLKHTTVFNSTKKQTCRLN